MASQLATHGERSRWLVTEALAAQDVNQGGRSVVRLVKELARPFELWRVDLLLMSSIPQSFLLVRYGEEELWPKRNRFH